jgi:type IV secretion system protein VirB9
MAYDYDDGALYRVYCAPLKLTDIQLQPGERMISNPGAADTTRWKVGASVSMVNGVEQQHLLVTPKRPDIETSLYIYTDRRTYHLELYSYKTTYMAAVSWNYATDTLETFNLQMDTAQAKNDDIDAARVDLTNANFAYTIDVKNGEPAWTPVRVFDNGKKTFIQFPNIISVSDSPALYISQYGEHELVNYRPVGDFYVIDGVFPRYELRVGTNEHMDIVEIINDDHSTRSSRADHRTSLFSDEES